MTGKGKLKQGLLGGGATALILTTTLWVTPALPADDAPLVLAVQPVLSQAETRKSFQPMGDYIREVTGKPVKLNTTENYLQYWLSMLDNQTSDFSWDPAFFADYRIKKLNYVPLVKVRGFASNTLVTRPDVGVFESDELVGKAIAAMPPPAPSGIFLQRMFPNPARQPAYVAAENSQIALKMLVDGKVDAAMVPSPDVPSLQVPHMALLAGPNVDARTRAAITEAFLAADKTERGKAMLKSIGVEGFEPTDRSTYDGYMQYLEKSYSMFK